MARKNQKNTEKPTEEKPAENASPAPRPSSERIKKALISWEEIQTFAIILAMVMGYKGKPAPGSPEEGRVPDWILSIIPEEFSIEDETWRNLILASCSNRMILIVEEEFRKRFVADPEGFDAGKYRTRLMAIMKEFLEQSGKLNSKNEPTARFVFEPTTFRNPCDDFFLQLIEETTKPGTPEEIYQRQKAIAIGRNLLVKMGSLKKAVHWIRCHKAETIVGAILIPIGFFQLIFWLLS